MVNGMIACIEVIVAAVLLIAGPGKVAAPARLAATLTAVTADRIPARSAQVVARVVGVVETVTAILLATAVWPPLTAVLLAALGLGIAGVSALAMARGLAVPCGCFAAADARTDRLLGPRTLAFGAGFVVVALLHNAVPAAGAVDLRLTTALTLALGFTLTSRAGHLRPLFARGFGRGQ